MKKFTFLLALMAILTVVGCNRDDIQREESFGDEIGHEVDEAGDNMEDAAEELD